MKIFKYFISLLFLGVVVFMVLWILNLNNILNLDFAFINNIEFVENIITAKENSPLIFNITFYGLIGILSLSLILGVLSTFKNRTIRIISIVFMWILLVAAIALITFSVLSYLYN